jgi:serine/threonine protein kinase
VNGRLIAGRYELASVLGQGGMGQVWTAYDRRLDRRVAVKLLRPDRVAGGADADELRRRFDRECRVTAQVDHSGLVTVHDAGSDGEELYLVMQYIEGEDLAGHIAGHRPYPWPWAVAVAAQLCAVLAAVHAVPIVHRDLKPRNIMVRPDGTVVVLDLGVASVLDTDTTRLTHTGAPIGTPAYMAPEQAMGGAIGPRTDLYALGVVLHEMVGGDVPFPGSTALGILHRHLYEPPAPLRTLRPEIPETLEAVVLGLLAKDPSDRPSDAQETYERLAALLPPRTPGPAKAAAGPELDPIRPFARPHAPWPERAVAGGRAMATGVPGPASGAGAAARVVPPVPAVPPLPAVPPQPSAPPSSPVGAPLTAPPSTPPSVPPVTPVPINVTGPGFGPPPDVPLAGDRNGDGLAAAVEEVKRLLDAGRVTQAVDVLGGVLPEAVRRHGEQSPVVRSLRRQYAATLMADGQYRRALPELRHLAEWHAGESGPGGREALRCRYEAAQCLEQLGEIPAALAEYRVLLPWFEHFAAADPVLPLEVRRRIGQLLLALGDHRGAHATLSRLLFDTDRLLGPQHPLAAEVRRTLSWLAQVGRARR